MKIPVIWPYPGLDGECDCFEDGNYEFMVDWRIRGDWFSEGGFCQIEANVLSFI